MDLMDEAQVGALISTIGLAVQAAGAFLLALMFSLLRAFAHRRDYFVLWGDAWVALFVALAALLGVFSLTDADASAATAGLFVYLAGKLAFFILLFAGAWNVARGGDHRRARRIAFGFALAYAAVALAATRSVASLLVLQAPVAVAMCSAAGWHFLRLDADRRSLGTRVASVAFLVFAGVWVLYGASYWLGPTPGGSAFGPFQSLAVYNSYLDLLLQTLLAISIVLVRMEDAKRETDAAHAELALAHQRLRDASLRDPLTGAFNRLAYSEGFGLEAARQSFGAVALLDLDDLKTVNDGWGHAAGDALLRSFVLALNAHLREGDRLYRMGGDEFLLVFPRADAADIGTRLAELLDNLPRVSFPDHHAGFQARASWGVAPYTGAASFELAIRKADQRMYERKRARKDVAPAAPPSPAV